MMGKTTTPRRLLLLMLLCVGNLCVTPVLSHEPMAHDCVAPKRPANDQDDRLWAGFLEEIEVFQACITRAADRHQAASDAHQRAAFAAVDAWNDFVRTSLNAPEDFPWPPEEN
jgi:hypothetical protein